MNLRELEAQAEFLAPVIAAAVAKAVAPLNIELTDLRKCLADRPEPINPAPINVEAIAQAAAALVVLPEVKDGKDADPIDLEALAKAAADLVKLPTPVEPNFEAIAQAAAALVVLPEVKDGKDAEPIDLEALAKAAAEFVQLPDIDIALLAAEAAKLVDVSEPIPGKNADPVDLQALARSAAEMVQVPEVRQPQDGRDALHLEILPGIDEAKTYARNTYAKHDGGLWRSFEQTSGMRGWECIVEGLKAVSVTQDGDREFSVTLAKSSGAEVVQKFTMPIQIYKGVHKDGEKYDQHDNVTWAGSQWTSTKAENTDKPGSSDAWTLVVKAGRNGKDLRENASTFDVSKGVKL